MTTIWHNPRCSKSRKTLALLQEKGIEPEIVEYLKTPPSAEELRQVLTLLDITAEELVRRGEAVFKEMEFKDADKETLIAAMTVNPILIERPVVIHSQRAAIGRPPENVLKIL